VNVIAGDEVDPRLTGHVFLSVERCRQDQRARQHDHTKAVTRATEHAAGLVPRLRLEALPALARQELGDLR
jgi:hypothetical protein